MAHVTEQSSEFTKRTRWYIRLRWFLLLAIVIPSLSSLYLGSGLAMQRRAAIITSVVVLATNGVFFVLGRLHRSDSYYRKLAMGLLAFDVLFITYFIYSKGGIESRSQLLYALPILMAAALFGRLAVYLTASGSALAYDCVILANYFGIVHSPEALTDQATNLTYVLNTIVFFSAVLLIVGGLADYITRLLVQKEEQAMATAIALKRAQAIARLGSWEWDLVSDKITWSDELYDIFGVDRESTSGTYEDYLKRLHPDDKKWMAGVIARSIRSHKPYSFDHRVVLDDGTIRIVHGEGKVLTDKHGKAAQLYGTAQDITAERALEVAKGDFVSLASHQLRTPASGVRMLLAMLRDDYVGRLTVEQRSTIKKAYDANERLLKIADDLLNVAKVESGRLVLNKQQMELTDWLKNLMVPQKLLAKGLRQKLRVIVPKGPVNALGDPERLAMVLDNLLSNARKYTPTGGSITVSLMPGRSIHRIVVSDTGSGMTKTERAQLFGKFTRLDNPASKGTEGSGLGLYLVKSIVDLHKGNIEVRSKPGVGTTFTVRLPKAAV